MFFILLTKIVHVEGINWLGPIAPPQPEPIGHESGMLLGSKPSAAVIAKNGAWSRVGFIIAAHFFEGGSPARLQRPTFSPIFDSCFKIARTKAGLTPVFLEASVAYSSALPKGIAALSRRAKSALLISAAFFSRSFKTCS